MSAEPMNRALMSSTEPSGPPGSLAHLRLDQRFMVLLGALACTTALSVILGDVESTLNGSYGARFLAWNLFLAWIPMLLAIGCGTATKRWLAWIYGLGWLAFLPNAPYLITDLVHLGGGRSRLWRHVLEFGFAAWTGTMLGVISLRIIHARVQATRGVLAGWLVVVASVGLCSVGVVIGRFQRWNSWDLITQPTAVARQTFDWVANPFSQVRDTGVAVAVASFFGLAYLTVWALDHADITKR
jgi:uncharacterized membrane protein